jgi:hypothetical protein
MREKVIFKIHLKRTAVIYSTCSHLILQHAPYSTPLLVRPITGHRGGEEQGGRRRGTMGLIYTGPAQIQEKV